MIQSQPNSSAQDLLNPALVFRPGPERFHSQTGWLDSWHSFSFAGHYDPRWSGFGPLLVINDDRIAAGQGFGMHPHRDMEIITVMVDGALHHRDSMGHSATLQAGEVQRMTAGTGIVHSEINGGEAACRLLQIWIEPSQQGIAPSYDQRAFPLAEGWTPLVDPEGLGGAMVIQRPVRLWRACPGAGVQLELALAPDTQGWIQVIAGSLAAGPKADLPSSIAVPASLGEGDGLGFRSGQLVSLTAASQGADLLLFELS